MIAAIPPLKQNCSCHPPTFISPVIRRDKKKLEKFLSEELKNFSSKAIKKEDELISLPDVFPDHYKDSDGDFLEEAAKKVYLHPNEETKTFHARKLIQKGHEVGVELNEEEAGGVIDDAVDRVAEVITWATANKKYGKESADYAIESTIWAVASTFTQNFAPENDSSYLRLLNIAVKALHGYSLGMRGKKLYGYIYGRADDDKGLCVFQRDNYENISGDLAELACIFETFKPWILPFLAVLDSDKKDTVTQLLTLPTNFLWSLRYLAFSDQRLAKYLYQYAKNILPSLLGNEDSKKVLEELIKTEVLSINSLKGQLKKTLRLKEGEKISSKLSELFLGLFSHDIKILEKSTRILNETIAPIVGIVGFSFQAVFTPLKAVTTFIGGEYISDSVRRKINSFASIRGSLQNILYSLRFSTKEYIRSQKIRADVESMDNDDPSKKELERLANKFCNLSKAGLIGNGINIILPFVKLFDDSSPGVKILKSVLDQAGYGISQWFFPRRRQYRGELFEVINPELSNDAQLQDDKLPPEEPPPAGPRLYKENG